MPPSADLTAEEIIKRRMADFARREAHELGRVLITAAIPVKGPFGVLFFGDPHLDDDGTDLRALRRDMDLVLTHGALWAANAGDTLNNWTAKLGNLWGQQSTTAKEAWTLANWFVGGLAGKWLWIVGGNHDAWSGAGDPLQWIAAQAGAPYEMAEIRVGLQCPNGKLITVNAHHAFNGNSMWNPAHAVMREAQKGKRDDLIVGAHTHTSGFGILKDPDTGKMITCLQLASYKVYDRYAREKGLADHHLSPSALVIFDPDAKTIAGLVQVFLDTEKGAAYLDFLRSKM